MFMWALGSFVKEPYRKVPGLEPAAHAVEDVARARGAEEPLCGGLRMRRAIKAIRA